MPAGGALVELRPVFAGSPAWEVFGVARAATLAEGRGSDPRWLGGGGGYLGAGVETVALAVEGGAWLLDFAGDVAPPVDPQVGLGALRLAPGGALRAGPRDVAWLRLALQGLPSAATADFQGLAGLSVRGAALEGGYGSAGAIARVEVPIGRVWLALETDWGLSAPAPPLTRVSVRLPTAR